MPTKEYSDAYYTKFGISELHREGIFGQNVSVYLIDVGLNTVKLQGVHHRHVPIKAVDGKVLAKTSVNHGSFVVSILAAKANETDDHVPGIAPQAQVYVADVTAKDGCVYTSSLIAAIHDAIDLSVDIISISLGTTVYSQPLEDAVKLATSRNILVFAASGNCSCRAYEFPAACDAAISVASMDINRQPSPFNTRNDSVAIFAPGHGVLVQGKRVSGTSFAVPFVSGLAALLLCKKRLIADSNVEPWTRQRAIHDLRAAMGLTNKHSYSNDIWSNKSAGGAFRPSSIMDHVTNVVIFNLISAAVGFYMFGLSHGRNTCSIRKLR